MSGARQQGQVGSVAPCPLTPAILWSSRQSGWMPCPQPSVVQGMPGLGCSRHIGHCPTSSSCSS
eukprot:14720956-Heterocapsa_arctica.AAC.1